MDTFAYSASRTSFMALKVVSPIISGIVLIVNFSLMLSTNIIILRSYWHSSSSRTHAAVCPVIWDLSLFRRGLVRSSLLFVSHCVIRALSRVVQASSVIFVVVVLSGPCRILSRPLLIFSSLVSRLRISAALAVLLPLLWRAHLSSMHDSHRSRPSWLPTCFGTQGSFYYVDLVFNR